MIVVGNSMPAIFSLVPYEDSKGQKACLTRALQQSVVQRASRTGLGFHGHVDQPFQLHPAIFAATTIEEVIEFDVNFPAANGFSA